MKSFTFTFIEKGHGSLVVVTAETEKDCREKYFMKYPERKDNPALVIVEGDHNYGFIMKYKYPNLLKGETMDDDIPDDDHELSSDSMLEGATESTDTFLSELTSLINRYSKENGSGTPDFILARFLESQLDIFNLAIQARSTWRGEDWKFKP